MVLSSSQGCKTFILVAISEKLNIRKEGRKEGKKEGRKGGREGEEKEGGKEGGREPDISKSLFKFNV